MLTLFNKEAVGRDSAGGVGSAVVAVFDQLVGELVLPFLFALIA